MIDLPTKAVVQCSDGLAGISTHVIGNPETQRMTHLVVKSSRHPFQELLVPIERVMETTPDQIRLKCTLEELGKMQPFTHEEFVRTNMPGVMYWPYGLGIAEYVYKQPDVYASVKQRNIPEGAVALQRDARVEATDGYVGQVDELLLNSETLQATHIVLLNRHFLKERELVIPVSEIQIMVGDTIYLKLDRKSVEELPTAPVQRWQ